MGDGLKSTEFWFGVLVVVCATVMLFTGDIDQDTWKWAVTLVGSAYVIGRSAVKVAANSGAAQVAEFREDLRALDAAHRNVVT